MSGTDETSSLTVEAKSDAKTIPDTEASDLLVGDLKNVSQAKKYDINSGISVEVKNPTIVKGSMLEGRYIIYDIEYTDKNGTGTTKRRYNDFFELRCRLVESWPGIAIPPIPEKKVQGNKDSDFVLERKSMLDYFFRRLSTLTHLFYTKEVQTFLRGTDGELKTEIGSARKVNPSECLEKYKQTFADFAEGEFKATAIASAEDFFMVTKNTLDFYSNFVRSGSWYNKLRNQNAVLYLTFVKTVVADYKRDLTAEEQQESLSKYNEFVGQWLSTASTDEVRQFNNGVKELHLEFSSLFEVRQSLRGIEAKIDETRKKMYEIQKEQARVEQAEGDMVKSSMFGGKVSKADRKKDLDKELAQCSENQGFWIRIKEIAYTVLTEHEIPRIKAIKTQTLSTIVRAYTETRKKLIRTELEMLQEIQSKYSKYMVLEDLGSKL